MARARILIVDDEPAIRYTLREYLEPLGYEVEEAATAVTALASVQARRPDAVLLDLMMPAISGQEVLAGISMHAPVIVISAVTNVELARRTVADGAFDFIMKPFDLGRVSAVIEAALLQGKP
jgi:DNA-binding NtrC family response regulator